MWMFRYNFILKHASFLFVCGVCFQNRWCQDPCPQLLFLQQLTEYRVREIKTFTRPPRQLQSIDIGGTRVRLQLFWISHIRGLSFMSTENGEQFMSAALIGYDLPKLTSFC